MPELLFDYQEISEPKGARDLADVANAESRVGFVCRWAQQERYLRPLRADLDIIFVRQAFVWRQVLLEADGHPAAFGGLGPKAYTISRSQIPGPALLRQELLHHAQRYLEAFCHLFSRPLPPNLGRHNPLP